MRISDWSSDVCSSDLLPEASAWLYEWRPCTADDRGGAEGARIEAVPMILVPDHDADIEQCAAPLLTEDRLGLRAVRAEDAFSGYTWYDGLPRVTGLSFATEIDGRQIHRSEEHTSELQSLMRISYAVFCLEKKQHSTTTIYVH